MLNIWIFFIALLKLSLALNETVESVCQQNSQISDKITTAYFNNKCYMVARYPNVPYTNITENCLSNMKNTSYCQVVHIHWFDEFNELAPKLGLTTNDKFFLGLSRLNCSNKWHWRYGNGTIKLYETTGFRLRELGQNCDDLNFAYNAGDFTTASSANFSTTQYVCECYAPSLPSSTYQPQTLFTLVSNFGIFLIFYSLKF